MSKNAQIRVRIAPSPTGYLHLGTIRAALFNFLFARKEKGVFIVRIEDTDKSRSLPMFEKDILNGLRFVGIIWDEGPDIGGEYGPYRQSERGDIYKKYLSRLLEERKAYWCFCSKEELEEEKRAMMSSGIFPKYSGKCKSINLSDAKKRLKNGEGGVIRISAPKNSEIEFNDIIREKISVNSDTIGDFVIAKGLDSSLYNFAVIIDDYEMKISHVVRGEDHISNTPKQIIIQNALGIPRPKYAHLPLVLAPDRSKLSKRSMETSFNEYVKDGYLPEAMMNFLALLGWHPGGNEEIMTIEEMIEKFNLRKVQKAGAVFDTQRLDWFNSQYIKKLSLEELVKKIEKCVPESWLSDKELLSKAVFVEKERIKTLSDFSKNASFFFKLPDYDKSLLRWKEAKFDNTANNLKTMLSEITGIKDKDLSSDTISKKIMPIAEKAGKGDLLWPLRVALSGKKDSPGPFEIIGVIGKKETIRRLNIAIEKISSN